MENRPVDFVSSYDALRFAKWLQNGQLTGLANATEDGAYTFTGTFTVGPRNAGARYWLPSLDEWYNAAYHKNDGVTGNYWDDPVKRRALGSKGFRSV
jgi:hypothetical protein